MLRIIFLAIVVLCEFIIVISEYTFELYFRFFGQLVDALDPQEFLAPICMLLVDKMANRIIRQNATDARNSLSLALTVLQRYPLELQLSVSTH